ncbi:CBS domain-containing protein [Cryptosporangium sp. NPDC048952]|uniref:CBS domain-containing protein n=1 Tax=Cryptosporangium sp. NPDC048952 TaxID=3363961 RepID=UPI00371DA65F
MRHRTVSDIMTTKVHTVDVTAPAKTVAKVLDANGMTGLPVLNQIGEVVGVVTLTDLLHKITYQDEQDDWPRLLRRHHVDRAKARAATAGELMTAPAITIGPDASIVEAAARLERHAIRRLPVVDSIGDLVGVLSRGDVIKVLTRPDAAIYVEVLSDVVERVLLLTPEAVEVQVTDGVVTLRGRLARRSEAVLVAALVRRIDGVIRVIDELTFDDDDTQFVYL